MDEAFVVLVVDPQGERICKAFPFATRAAADAAMSWLKDKLPTAETVLINDHERKDDEEDDC